MIRITITRPTMDSAHVQPEAAGKPMRVSTECHATMSQATAISSGFRTVDIGSSPVQATRRSDDGAGVVPADAVEPSADVVHPSAEETSPPTGGTVSTPPEFQGLHRSNRHAASRPPRSTPCRSTAINAYSEQDG